MARKPICITIDDSILEVVNATADTIHFSKSWIIEYLVKKGIQAGGIGELTRFGTWGIPEVE